MGKNHIKNRGLKRPTGANPIGLLWFLLKLWQFLMQFLIELLQLLKLLQLLTPLQQSTRFSEAASQ